MASNDVNSLDGHVRSTADTNALPVCDPLTAGYYEYVNKCLAAFNVDGKAYSWASDTGTNHHATHTFANFVLGSYVVRASSIQVGGGVTISPGYGKVLLRADHGNGKFKDIMLLETLFLPQCPVNLCAVSPFVRAGCRAVMDNSTELVISKDGELVLRGKECQGLYVLMAEAVKATTPPSTSPSLSFSMLESGNSDIQLADKLLQMHRGYGHLHFDTLRKLLVLAGLNHNRAADAFPRNKATSRGPPLTHPHNWHASRSEKEDAWFLT